MRCIYVFARRHQTGLQRCKVQSQSKRSLRAATRIKLCVCKTFLSNFYSCIDKEKFRKWLLNRIFHVHPCTSLLPLSELYLDMKQIHDGNSFLSFLRIGLREFLDVQYDTQKCLKGSFHISPCQDELHIRFWSQRYICFSHCWRHWRCNWFTFEHF